MAKWQPQRGWRRFLYTRLALGALGFIVLLLGHSVWREFWKHRLVASDRAEVESKLQALREREQKLQTELLMFKSEAGLERKIREKFPVVKEGEKVITIVASSDTATDTPLASPSWWSYFWPTRN